MGHLLPWDLSNTKFDKGSFTVDVPLLPLVPAFLIFHLLIGNCTSLLVRIVCVFYMHIMIWMKRAIGVSIRLWNFVHGFVGDGAWGWTYGTTSLVARSANMQNLTAHDPQEHYKHYNFLARNGKIFGYTSSPVSQRLHKVTMPSWLWLTGVQKWCTWSDHNGT